MKRIIALLTALMLFLMLAGCGGKEPGDETPEMPEATDTQPGNETPEMPEATDTQPLNTMSDSETIPDLQMKVTVDDNKVITTQSDNLGTTSVIEYIFKDGSVDEIKMTVKCPDNQIAAATIESMKSGELGVDINEVYSEIKLDGNNIVCEMTDEYVDGFAGISQEALADVLTSAGNVVTNPSYDNTPGEADSSETKLNVKWDELLTLPSDFPKLYDGVTSFYATSDESFTLEWNYLPLSDAEEMANKLESWLGATADKMDDGGSAFWYIVSADATANATIAYYRDTYGGALSQCIITIYHES